ncbi:adenylate kinase 7 isoform X2 [Notolabrus celidotus]|uniref:adenylate kinase 7 isoform X2 n=1 Tax=Notolabrus celidotus TaxID=1203425 RepID=UPI00148FB3B8|nr:adenylate kinase 7 isoform X2 [Notolabrus celidotus]
MATKASKTATNMAERIRQRSPKRVFINNIDSYTSKHISKFLSECVLGADADGENEEEEERRTSDHIGEKSFHVVGTVSGSPEEEEEKEEDDRPYLLEEYSNMNRDALLSKLMLCDVVIYNITQHAEQVDEALWAVTALHDQMETFSAPKTFILISTVMTWACSKPVDPDDLELPFTDEFFRRRRSHPNFKRHIDLEKRAVKMGKTNRKLFSTYVVASGLQYGMGEQIFHFFFKTSWLGQKERIPVFGDGLNIVPMIHVTDLASVVQNVIEHQPMRYYLLAVDQSHSSMEDIVKAVASVLGPAKIQKRPFEEAFLTQDLSVMEVESLQVNLRMEAVHIKELFSVSWCCESGLLENLDQVVEEFRQTRGLLPLRVCVLGPPAVGKSSVCKQISKHYKLHHITLKETISETIAQLESAVDNYDPEAENDHSAEDLLFSLKESMEQNAGWLEDHLLVKVLKHKLTSNPCRNQGFILDGFPKTCEQAKELFSAPSDEDHESEAETSLSSSQGKIIPEFLLVLDSSDSFLQDQVMNLPERLVQEWNYEQDHFLQRLNRYRETNMEEETVVNFFDEQDLSLLYLEVTSSSETDSLQLMQKIIDTLGPPRNYGCSIQEKEEEERREAEQSMMREEQERAEEMRKEEEEARHRAARWEEWTRRRDEERRHEEDLLEAQTVSMRTYLEEHVMPTLQRGLLECCTARPSDPVDFLAEFLLKHNPSDS